MSAANSINSSNIMGDELLQGDLIELKQVQREHLPIFVEWFAGDIGMMRNLGALAYPFTLEDEEKWFEDLANRKDNYHFTIHTLADDTLIGSCSLMDMDWRSRHCKLGIMIGREDYRNRGFGSDVMRVLLKYAFLELNLNRVGLNVFSYNERGLAVYKKVGFQVEVVERAKIARDGQRHDDITMGILRREWEALYR